MPLRTIRARPGHLDRAGLRRVLAVLCLTEITSWGILYYAFPVLSPSISADTGWSAPAITAAFSAGQITAAMIGIPVGRALDRLGPRWLMSVGSVLGTTAVVLVASAESLALFWLGWLLAGVAMAGVLYQPAFAALTHWWGERRVAALTSVTLVAGLASTVFAPLTAALDNRFGWRDTYLMLAVVLAVVTVPAHAIGLRGPWPASRPAVRAAAPVERARRITRCRSFALLVLAMSLAAFGVYSIVFATVPLLLERGLSTQTAALALGLGGVGQVCGRLAFGRLHRALPSAARRGVAVLGVATVSTAALAVVPGPAGLLLALGLLVGAARGLFTLLQATAVSDRWGSAHYGRLNGLLGAPSMVAAAVAPWGVSVLGDGLGSYSPVVGLLAALTALAMLAMLGTTPTSPLRPG
jgi:MFS family permease